MKESYRTATIVENSRVPDELAEPLLDEIKWLCRRSGIRIVVVDDDPTGSQTIYNLPVITSWDQALIEAMMQEDHPGFFILTNSRSLPESEAVAINREIARLAGAAAEKFGYTLLWVSRGDSTLRGHFPAELLALNSGLPQQADGFVLMPYFQEGGRLTVHGIHYLKEEDRLVPVSCTSFANDPVFRFSTSDLKKYIAEKSGGHIPESAVMSIGIAELQRGPDAIMPLLSALSGGRFAVADGSCLYHAAALALSLIRLHLQGKRLLVRCAPSLVQALFGIGRPGAALEARQLYSGEPEPAGGLIIVGSFVPQTTRQIRHLLEHTDITGLELVVHKLFDADAAAYLQQLVSGIATQLENGRSVVLYSSRELIGPADRHLHAQAAARISDALVTVVRKLPVMPRFLVAKGGITGSDIASRGLGIRKAMVLGQLLPGVQVWKTEERAKFSRIPYIIVPGNVGADDYLTRICQKLNGHASV
jgi:uncharacterized protein YgbK (DUF1537 family)